MEAAPEFFERAICHEVGPQVMVPDEHDVRAVAVAKSVCIECPDSSECLNWALEQREFAGVYGGTTGRERRRILRIQRIRHAETESR